MMFISWEIKLPLNIRRYIYIQFMEGMYCESYFYAY